MTLLILSLLACGDDTTTGTTSSVTDTDTPPTEDTGPFDSDDDGVQDRDDCAPEDPVVYPGADETWYDGTDQDCDGNDADADEDGFDWEGVAGGDDCDDTDASIYPGAPETWYDDIDQDCAGDEDEQDRDGDGWAVFEDCDDNHPFVYPGAEEHCDGLDHDCDSSPLVPEVCGHVQTTDSLWTMTMMSLDSQNGFASQEAQFLGDMDGDGDEEVLAYCAHCLQTDGDDDDLVLTLLSTGAAGWDLLREDEQAATFESSKSRYGGWATMPGEAGDWTGDGVADLLFRGGGDHVSSLPAYVAVLEGPLSSYGPGAGILASAETWFFNDDHSLLGNEAAQGGDYTGDGLDDLIIVDPGPWSDKEGPTTTHVHLLPGRTGEWGELDSELEPRLEPIDAEMDDAVEGVGFLGDLDGDGLDDVWFTHDPAHDVAVLYLVSGADLPATQGEVAILEDIASEGWTGPAARAGCLGRLGDLDGDGTDDWYTGSTGYDEQWYGQGAIWISLEAPGSGSPDLEVHDDEDYGFEHYLVGSYESNALGKECHSADFDGDGSEDIVSFMATEEGQHVHAILPGHTLLSGPATPVQTHLDLADVTHVWDAGDYDGDGFDDLLYAYPYPDEESFWGLAVLPGWDVPWDDRVWW